MHFRRLFIFSPVTHFRPSWRATSKLPWCGTNRRKGTVGHASRITHASESHLSALARRISRKEVHLGASSAHGISSGLKQCDKSTVIPSHWKIIILSCAQTIHNDRCIMKFERIQGANNTINTTHDSHFTMQCLYDQDFSRGVPSTILCYSGRIKRWRSREYHGKYLVYTLLQPGFGHLTVDPGCCSLWWMASLLFDTRGGAWHPGTLQCN